MADLFSQRYGDLLTGSYDCVDRIVLNAYFSLGHNAGGFRVWWRRWHDGSDEELDNAHLMRLAGRFARRVRAFGKASNIPVLDCGREERKHRIAEDYLREHTVGPGVFLILVARAPARVCDRQPGEEAGVRQPLLLSPHRPDVGARDDQDERASAVRRAGDSQRARVRRLRRAGGRLGFAKEGNCFTRVDDPERLAQVADTLSQPGTIGRLSQVIDRWIYTACLCFGLDRDEQARSGFGYTYSIYQVEYSRNLLFACGAVMDRVFDAVVDRTRSRLDVPKVRTLFGSKGRPHRTPGAELSPRQAVVIERPRWNLTIFKVHFGLFDAASSSRGLKVTVR